MGRIEKDSYSQCRARMERAKQRIDVLNGRERRIGAAYSAKIDELAAKRQALAQKYREARDILTGGDDSAAFMVNGPVERLFDYSEKTGVEPAWFYRELCAVAQFVRRSEIPLPAPEPETAADYCRLALRRLKEVTMGAPPGRYQWVYEEVGSHLAEAEKLAKAGESEGSPTRQSVVFRWLQDHIGTVGDYYWAEQHHQLSGSDW